MQARSSASLYRKCAFCISFEMELARFWLQALAPRVEATLGQDGGGSPTSRALEEFNEFCRVRGAKCVSSPRQRARWLVPQNSLSEPPRRLRTLKLNRLARGPKCAWHVDCCPSEASFTLGGRPASTGRAHHSIHKVAFSSSRPSSSLPPPSSLGAPPSFLVESTCLVPTPWYNSCQRRCSSMV